MGIPASDNLLWLHGKTRAADGSFAGTAFCQGGAEASELYLQAEGTYSDFAGKENLGVMVAITEAYATTTAVKIDVVHAAATPTTTTIIGSRTFTVAQLALGKRYWIPFYAKTITKCLGIYGTPSTNASAGKICAWVAEGPQGAE
jgi:hypothetical protein